ncbi:unnamed protein product, partial [Discosporangium mesarthrocarpum]
MKEILELVIPGEMRSAVGNRERAEFEFTKVLGEDISQEEVFDTVAARVVTDCLHGCNGTIFAYGQTGSGKTHTMTGGESFEDRGIAPRVIGRFFREIREAEEADS